MARKNLVGGVRRFVKVALPAIIKPIHALWHEIIGFLFVSIAILVAASGIRTFNKFDGSIGAVLTIGMYIFVIILMTGYGISSFRRARKISRS